MDEAVREFVDETHERLVRSGQNLVALEEQGADEDLVGEVFRDFHTIKGNCGFFQFETLQEVAHSGEDVLTLLRSGDLEVDAELTEVLLDAVDAMEEILEGIREEETEPERDYGDLIARLEYVQSRADDEGDGAIDPPGSTGGDAVSGSESPEGENGGNREAGAEGSDTKAAAADDPAAEADADSTAREDDTSATGTTSKPQPSEGSVRVDLELLDDLMNQMTELILARNQLQEQFGPDSLDGELEQAYKKLDLVTSQLQETVMETRMRPIGRIWQRYPRMIRDLAREYDKEIGLELEGAETELDKNLIERISDPVTHLVRNAADHGIEPPEERERAGKPREGTIRVRAFQDQGRVNLQVVDDGRGLDPAEIGPHAVEQGLVSPDELDDMSDSQIRRLLFQPGFSTSSNVTDVSGRGVGLDVVKQGVEQAGGSIRLESEPGEGTLVELQLPLTLAVISSLLVETNGQEFVLPQEDVRRLARVDPGDPDESVEMIHGTAVYRYDDRLLPMVCLDRLLGVDAPSVEERLRAETPFNLVVTRSPRSEFGLVVDDVVDTQDVVVKSLPALLQDIGLYAGAVVKGDRSVAIILSTSGIAEEADLTVGEAETPVREQPRADRELAAESVEEEEIREVLWCRSRDDGRIAIPLDMLERLEYIDRTETRERGGAMFVPYRDDLLPLVDVEDQLPERRSEPRDEQLHRRLRERDKLPVALYRAGTRQIGLVMTEFLQILETSLSDRRGVSRPGVAFCTMIEEEITEVVDIPAVLERSEIEL